jgi:glycerol-3-phosphate dehydrogenase
MTSNNYDVLIIGAGALGCAIAREVSRFNVSAAVLDKESDAAAGASGRNSAVVHAGFNSRPDTKMARFCVQGNQEFEALSRELDFPYRKTGKLVVALTENDLPGLNQLYQTGVRNGVRGLEIIDSARIRQLEPHIQGTAALFSPETAVVNPFLYTVALAENAIANGVRFFTNTEVRAISRTASNFHVQTNRGDFYCRGLINAAGLFSDRVAAMAGDGQYRLYPCRGEYHILDKRAGQYLSMPVYPVPNPGSGGLGVHLTPTADGNILIGPSDEYLESRVDYGNTAPVMAQLMAEARQMLPPLAADWVIRSYAGLRAKQTPPAQGGYADFTIEASRSVPGLIHLVGIESPGLTASVPIARHVVDLLSQRQALTPKVHFSPERKGPLRFGGQNPETQRRLVENHPNYGEIICRCEKITRQEILEALRNPLGAQTLTAIKNRTRAMTGRCQGGYCTTRIVRILTEEFHMPLESIRLGSPASWLFTGNVKTDAHAKGNARAKGDAGRPGRQDAAPTGESPHEGDARTREDAGRSGRQNAAPTGGFPREDDAHAREDDGRSGRQNAAPTGGFPREDDAHVKEDAGPGRQDAAPTGGSPREGGLVP